MDAVEVERLRKERDNLLWAIEELHMGIDLARQERTDAQQRIGHLEDELQAERDLKVAAEGMSTGLTAEVSQRQEEVQCLEAEVTQQRDEVRRLQVDMNGKPPVSLVVFLPRIRGTPFDMVGM